MVLSPADLKAGTFKNARLECHLSVYSVQEVRVSKDASGRGRGLGRPGITLGLRTRGSSVTAEIDHEESRHGERLGRTVGKVSAGRRGSVGLTREVRVLLMLNEQRNPTAQFLFQEQLRGCMGNRFGVRGIAGLC